MNSFVFITNSLGLHKSDWQDFMKINCNTIGYCQSVSHSLNYSWISLSMRGQLNIISDITIIWTMAHIFLFSWKCIDNSIRLQSATSFDWYVYTNIQITALYNIQIGNRFFSLVKQIVPLSNINIMYYNSFGKYTQRYPAVINENYSTFFFFKISSIHQQLNILNPNGMTAIKEKKTKKHLAHTIQAIIFIAFQCVQL